MTDKELPKREWTTSHPDPDGTAHDALGVRSTLVGSAMFVTVYTDTPEFPDLDDPTTFDTTNVHLEVQQAREAAAALTKNALVCERLTAQWGRAILHSEGYEGEPGLRMLRPGETPEQCVGRHDLDPDKEWRVVRARRVTLRPSECGSVVDLDDLTERLEEWLGDGGQPDWHAQWDDAMLHPKPGAEEALRVALDAWAAEHLTVDAWEVHPEDQP